MMTAQEREPLNPDAIMAAHARHRWGPDGLCILTGDAEMARMRPCLAYLLAAENAALRDLLTDVVQDYGDCCTPYPQDGPCPCSMARAKRLAEQLRTSPDHPAEQGHLGHHHPRKDDLA